MSEYPEIEPLTDLRRLRTEVMPARDLWPAIRPRLRQRRQHAPWVSLALAASLVAGLAIQVRVMAPLPAAPSEDVVAAVPAQIAPVLYGHQRALVRAHLKIVSDAERQLLDALRQHPGSESLKRLLESSQRQRRDLRRLLAKYPV